MKRKIIHRFITSPEYRKFHLPVFILLILQIFIFSYYILSENNQTSQNSNTLAQRPAQQLLYFIPTATPIPPTTITPTPSPTPSPTPIMTPVPAAPAASSTKSSSSASQTSSTGSSAAQSVVQLAKEQIGKMYAWGVPPRIWSTEDPNAGKTPSNFDWSGLVGWAWYWGSGGKVSMAGKTLTDWTSGKYQKFTAAQKNQLKPGDQLYFGTSDSTVHHTWFSSLLRIAA